MENLVVISEPQVLQMSKEIKKLNFQVSTEEKQYLLN